ncbi:MAG: toprim domain-containing protein [Actinomycetota bacterium]|nr:toprim domain-containing protein [Actinomycetota bacterium]
MIEHYVRLCESVLSGPQGRGAREWLRARGLTDDTIQANRIGADPGRILLRRERGLPYGSDAAAVLPALDPSGRVVYVQARYLDPDVTGRKYDNPSAALAPHPRLAYPAPNGERGEVLLVCEGLPDALIASQMGFRAVALLGAQTPDQSVASRLANFASEHGLAIAIAADSDPAGHRLTATLTELLRQRNVDAVSVTPPEGLDLNAWALVDPSWHDWIDRAIHPTPTVEIADELEIDCIDL